MSEPAAANPDPFEVYKAIREMIVYGESVGDGWSFKGIANVDQIVARIQGPFCTRGELRVDNEPEPVNFDARLLVDGADVGSLDNLDIDALTSAATVAGFGRGGETVVDASVRNTLDIPASHLSFVVPEGKHPWNCLTDILPRGLWRKIIIFTPRDHVFCAKLSKMHIYQTGGKFDTHLDTVHAANHMATLVVTLPTVYSGGGLVIEHAGQVEVIGRGAEGTTDRNAPTFACFYTDYSHRLETVTSGTRIALQWDLYCEVKEHEAGREDPLSEVFGVMGDSRVRVERVSAAASAGAAAADAQAAHASIVSQLCDATTAWFKANPDQDLAIPLSHLYPLSGLKPELLRGGDQALHQVVAEVARQQWQGRESAEAAAPALTFLLLHMTDGCFGLEPDEWAQPITMGADGLPCTVKGGFDTTLTFGARGFLALLDQRDSVERVDDEPLDAKHVYQAVAVVMSNPHRGEQQEGEAGHKRAREESESERESENGCADKRGVSESGRGDEWFMPRK